LLVAVHAERVLLEVNFDLALNQESETGYTASHTVSEYLQDEELLWMRYFHTLVSGQPGNAPMRVSLIEFKSIAGWAKFEQGHIEGTHILYDLFWINWRKLLWFEKKVEGGPAVKTRQAQTKGGYVWAFRWSWKEAKSGDAVQSKCLATAKKEAEANAGFLERRAYTSGSFQSEFQNLLTYEFNSMQALSQFVYENANIQNCLKEYGEHSTKFASTVLAPSADNQGGQIFFGAHHKPE